MRRGPTTRTGALLAALLALAGGACRTPALPSMALPRCPGMLRPTEESAGEFLLRAGRSSRDVRAEARFVLKG